MCVPQSISKTLGLSKSYNVLQEHVLSRGGASRGTKAVPHHSVVRRGSCCGENTMLLLVSPGVSWVPTQKSD